MSETKISPLGILATIREMYGSAADADSYKLTHIPQYVKGAKQMVSYGESRGGTHEHTLWFGMQMVLLESFCQPLTHQHVDMLILFAKQHFMGADVSALEESMRTVVDEYEGKWPIRVRAAKEGALIPTGNILFSVESTKEDPRVATLVSYFETVLVRVWSPTTVATESYEIREILKDGLQRTTDDWLEQLPFKLHDFGSRGVGHPGVAATAGAGHLVSFQGSDTVIAVIAANLAYDCEMSAYSIPASEHSTTTMHGREGEEQLITQMFDAYAKPGAIFATVIDSYNWINFIRNIAPKFKDRLIESGATWVFRPDSGDPVETPLQVIRELAEVFGYTVNNRGYKVLNNVRVIQGDGIDRHDVRNIVMKMLNEKWCISNIAFGMGGGLLQKNNRDTQKFAMKCCAVLDGSDEWVDVYKEPAVFDPETWEIDVAKSSFKKSKPGRLELLYNTQTGGYETMTVENAAEFVGKYGWEYALETVYEDGEMIKTYTMEEVRKNAGII